LIIDSTYFINKLALPQLSNAEGLIAVNNFILQYESEFLECALGFDLWQAFVAGVEDSSPEERWLWLLEGQNYTINGRNGTWRGFENHSKLSPIANYVFYQFMDNKAVDFVLTGNVISSTENNRTVNGVDRMIDTWNRMVDLNTDLIQYLRANKSLYPEWKECTHGWLTHYWWYNHCSNSFCHYSKCASNVFRKKNSYDL
jgi:hypothetical protein